MNFVQPRKEKYTFSYNLGLRSPQTIMESMKAVFVEGAVSKYITGAIYLKFRDLC